MSFNLTFLQFKFFFFLLLNVEKYHQVFHIFSVRFDLLFPKQQSHGLLKKKKKD